MRSGVAAGVAGARHHLRERHCGDDGRHRAAGTGRAVRRDEIVAVGAVAAIRALAGPTTAVTDLEGRTMVPGFYAAHDHFPGSGRAAVSSVDLNSPPIGTIDSMDQRVEAVRARAEATRVGPGARL